MIGGLDDGVMMKGAVFHFDGFILSIKRELRKNTLCVRSIVSVTSLLIYQRNVCRASIANVSLLCYYTFFSSCFDYSGETVSNEVESAIERLASVILWKCVRDSADLLFTTKSQYCITKHKL